MWLLDESHVWFRVILYFAVVLLNQSFSSYLNSHFPYTALSVQNFDKMMLRIGDLMYSNFQLLHILNIFVL